MFTHRNNQENKQIITCYQSYRHLWRRVVTWLTPLAASLLITVQLKAMPAEQLTKMSPVLTTVDAPINHVASTPSFYDGVGRLSITTSGGGVGCSASLLSGGSYLLTAAHCLTNGSGALIATQAQASFRVGGANQINVTSNQFFIHPDWNGTLFGGADLALIQLTSPILGISGYNLYRTAAPIGSIMNIAGYGQTGQGINSGSGFGVLRQGLNELDGFWGINGNAFRYDFDDGTVARNSLGGLGLGLDEVMIASGDSGGPVFIDGLLAGAHSFILSAFQDADQVPNSSFGEMGGSTQVSSFLNWLDPFLGTTVPPTGTVPTNNSVWLLMTGLLLCVAQQRMRSTRC